MGQCYMCTYTKVDDSATQALIDAFGNDPKCNEHGADFLASPSGTETCFGSTGSTAWCTKADVDMQSKNILTGKWMKTEVLYRGCDVHSDSKGYANGCTDKVEDYVDTDSNTKDLKGTGCSCDTDLCNGSPSMMISSLALLAGVLLAIFKF